MFTNSRRAATATRAATMLLLLLLLPAIQTLGNKLLNSKTEPPATLSKPIKSCPSEGYFFERDQQSGIEPAPCYFCYCKSDELAVCTLRESARCDDENRSYRTDVETTSRRYRRKHRRRLPRSPGLMELFFKDGKNEDILKEMAQHNDEDCKPKSSKSIGCPPKNWCTGCLVCDCDDDGIWRCHVMSFCEDHTSRPNSTKNWKTENSLLKILAPAKKVKKRLMAKKKKAGTQTLKKSVQEKKTEKRSVKPNNTDIAPPKNYNKMKNKTIKVFKKRSNTTRTTTSITTTKPVMPLISVKTKSSFLRKDKKDKVLVIKKYISTMSPIESPELLKYRNDSRKLAQILYQHYEASSIEKKKTKREVKHESIAASKALATHEFSENNETQSQKRIKAKFKYHVRVSRTVGDKVLNMKPKPKIKKNNVMGRKPTNIKQNGYRNTKMKELKETGKRKRYSFFEIQKDTKIKELKETGKRKRYSFFEIQKELMETGTISNVKRKQKEGRLNDYNSNYEGSKKKLITLANRKKRDVSLPMVDANYLTKVGNETVNTSSVNIDQVSKTPAELSTTQENVTVNTSSTDIQHVTETPVELLTNNEEIATNINNYVYEVDNTAMKNDSGSATIESNKEYDATLRYEITNASENIYMEITTTKIPKQANDNLQVLSVDFNDMLTETEQPYLRNSYSENPTSTADYAIDGKPDDNDKLKSNIDITTTSFVNYNAFERSESVTQQVNNTDNSENLTSTADYALDGKPDENDELKSNIDITTTSFYNYNAFENSKSVTHQVNNTDNIENPTSTADYALDGKSDENDKLKNNIDITTTPFFNYNAFEKSESVTQQVNNTDNQKIMHVFSNNTKLTANVMNHVYSKDDNDTLKTDLNETKLEKIVNTNASNVINITQFDRPQNHAIDRNFSKNYKHISKSKMVGIKYLKKIYSKLLSNKSNNKTQFSDKSVMKSICDTFGPCKISSKNVHLINAKITELVYETKRALNIVKTIKRSLQVIDGGKTSTGNLTEENKFKSHVSKLNAILTDTFETPRTIHEIAVMMNIKINTQHFINSVSKFTSILNDILKIIRLDKIKYDNLKKRKMTLKKVIRPKVDSELLHTIKRLFLKFNLLQNNFMHKMYQVLTDLDVQNHNTVAVDKNKYDQREKRYKMSVKKYMNKINHNLKKLKNFALKRGTGGRMKRYARDDDDAIEYLLTLMEYLLRLNNPVDSSRVTDGVDLLLDAIRRAPDIKPIKKSNLEETSTSYSPVKELSQSSSDSEDENDSSSAKETEILTDDLNLEKWLNDKESKPSYLDNKLDEEYKTTTPDNPQKTSAVTKYVDVEDIVFNGDEHLNVYMATDPTFDNIQDTNFIERRANSKTAKRKKSERKPATNKPAATSTVPEKTQTKPQVNNATENSTKSHFDLLNEEYENRLKSKPPTNKPIRVKINKKHKKRRPRVRHQTDAFGKTDVSSITKETEEERTRMRVVAEETNLRRGMISSDDESFKSMGGDSVSKDISLIEGVDQEPFKSYIIANFH